MKAKCTCKREFEFTPQTETIKEVDITFAECSYCNKRYFSNVQDSEVKDRIEKTKYVPRRYKPDYIEKTRDLMREKQDEYSELIDGVINEV